MPKRKVKKRKGGVPSNRRMLYTCLVNLAVTAAAGGLLLALGAVFVLQLDLGASAAYYLTFPIIALCAFVNGFVMAKLVREKGLLVGALSSIFLVLFLIIGNMFIQDENHIALFLVKIGLAVVFGCCGGIVGVNQKKKLKV